MSIYRSENYSRSCPNATFSNISFSPILEVISLTVNFKATQLFSPLCQLFSVGQKKGRYLLPLLMFPSSQGDIYSHDTMHILLPLTNSSARKGKGVLYMRIWGQGTLHWRPAPSSSFSSLEFACIPKVLQKQESCGHTHHLCLAG